MRRFLRFVVETALAGEQLLMKESVIGVEVFDRTADYNPKIDPIVRNEARLRTIFISWIRCGREQLPKNPNRAQSGKGTRWKLPNQAKRLLSVSRITWERITPEMHTHRNGLKCNLVERLP